MISNITKREKVAKVSYKEQDGKSMMTFIPKTFFLRELFFFPLVDSYGKGIYKQKYFIAQILENL